MDAYQPLSDISGGLNLPHSLTQLGQPGLDFNIKASDLTRKRQTFDSHEKPSKKNSGQRSSSATILDKPSSKDDPDLTCE